MRSIHHTTLLCLSLGLMLTCPCVQAGQDEPTPEEVPYFSNLPESSNTVTYTAPQDPGNVETDQPESTTEVAAMAQPLPPDSDLPP